MKRSRTGTRAGKGAAPLPVAAVQVPLPLLDVLADVKTAFFGLCLTAGLAEARRSFRRVRGASPIFPKMVRFPPPPLCRPAQRDPRAAGVRCHLAQRFGDGGTHGCGAELLLLR